ncbi:MAG: hexose kinase [Oscillospiraceae bacterium]|nr:hexose kinase [Oscillospiraceae bacterium]
MKLFDRIITVTLNPALDVTLWIPSMDLEEPNKTTAEKIYAGGKGVNISRVLASLNVFSLAAGIVGEDNQKMFTDLLEADGVGHRMVSVKGAVRENITLVTPGNQVLKVNRAGCAADVEALKEVRRQIVRAAEDYSSVLLIFAGSLPPGISAADYKNFILSLKGEKVKVAVDTSVFTAEDIEEIRPWMIKPNLPEFRQMCGKAFADRRELTEAALRMNDFVEHVMISLGGDGLLYANGGQILRLIPPAVEVRSTVGAGDTTLAAFIYAMQMGNEPGSAAVFASAAGTASVMLDGTEAVTLDQIEAVLDRMAVETI